MWRVASQGELTRLDELVLGGGKKQGIPDTESHLKRSQRLENRWLMER